MSQNDTTINPTQGADVYSGIRNPTESSTNTDPAADNYVTDPTSTTQGAGADPNIDYAQVANRGLRKTAGVVEQRPGLIESTNIDPLNEDSNKDDGWANATVQPGSTESTTTTGTDSYVGTAASYLPSTEQVTGLAQQAASTVAGAGKYAYGHVTGDNELKQEGREDISKNTGY